MRLEGNTTYIGKPSGISYGTPATKGQSELNIPEISSGVQATFTVSRNGELYAREMSLPFKVDRSEDKIKDDTKGPTLQSDPYASLADKVIFSQTETESVPKETEHAIEAYTRVSEEA